MEREFKKSAGICLSIGAVFATLTMAMHPVGGSLTAIAQMQNCKPGTSVIFDNVQVMGPDGTKRTIQAPGFLLK